MNGNLAPPKKMKIASSLDEWCVSGLSLVDIRVNPDCWLRGKDDDDDDDNETAAVVVVNLPFPTLLSGERSCELPPRHVPFALLVPEDWDREAVEGFFTATVSKATQQSRKPWLVRLVLVASSGLWNQAKEQGLLLRGVVSSSDKAALAVFQPLPRLWKPDPLFPHLLWPLLKTCLSLSEKDNHCAVWDLGSGAGRDVCYLAEQIKHCGYASLCSVVGIDNHKASAKRCLPFWRHRHVDDCTKALYLDLNKIPLVKQELSNQTTKTTRVVCFYAVRFWNRKLVTFIAKEAKVATGTLFGMSHFCKPHKGAKWDFDHPKVSPKHRCCVQHRIE